MGAIPQKPFPKGNQVQGLMKILQEEEREKSINREMTVSRTGTQKRHSHFGTLQWAGSVQSSSHAEIKTGWSLKKVSVVT